MHRSEAGGTSTCTPCLKEETERTRARKSKAASQPVGTPVGDPVEVAAKPVALPEPKSNAKPILFALLAVLPVAAYLWWLGGTLAVDNEWPGWFQPALCGGGSVFSFAGIWAILKSQ